MAKWTMMITSIFYDSDIHLYFHFTGKLMSLPGEIDKNLSFLVGSLYYSAFVFYFSDDFLLCAARSLFHACLHWEWLLPGIRACNTYFREFEFSVSIHNSLKHWVWSRVLVATCSY